MGELRKSPGRTALLVFVSAAALFALAAGVRSLHEPAADRPERTDRHPPSALPAAPQESPRAAETVAPPVAAAGDDARADEERAMNVGLPDAERLLAASRVRARGVPSKPALRSLCALMAGSADAEVRRDLIRLLKGIADEELTAAWLSRLQSDPSADVRKAAASALGDRQDNPGIRQALELAGRSDPSPGVRSSIRNVLGKRSTP